ncbi:MAG TPA: SusC/RagA family TonB-linked outer membrane protein, partial [Butyricimonas virosa]|nr:SusC/RagA family TonB-linked outer membrane protein [Butyricimonas virosa]
AGTTEPKFTGGFINRFYYKNFDLTISTSFIIDQTMQETPFYNPSATSPGSNYSNRVSQIWSSSNTTGLYPKVLGNNENDAMIYNWYNSDDPANSFKNYDYWFKDMSYLRVNSIRLGYTLPNEVIKKLRLGSARISFEARNPFVIASSY